MSYVQEQLGAVDYSHCTQNPSDPVCQAFYAPTSTPGTSSITGLPFSSIPSEAGAPGMARFGAKPGLDMTKIAAIAGVTIIAVMFLRPKSNPRRRRYRRRRR